MRRPDFTRAFHAVAKSYRYRIVTAPVLLPFDRLYVWHAPEPKRLEWMREAAAVLVGRHDFASFQARGAFVRETVRTIHRLDLHDADGEIRIECEGDGFLRHMVRTIAGTLAEIGTGLRPVAAMADDPGGPRPARRRRHGARVRTHADGRDVPLIAVPL